MVDAVEQLCHLLGPGLRPIDGFATFNSISREFRMRFETSDQLQQQRRITLEEGGLYFEECILDLNYKGLPSMVIVPMELMSTKG